MQLLPQHPDDIAAKVLAGVVGHLLQAIEPHGAGEQVGAGEGDLDRPSGTLPHELQLMQGEGAAASQGAEDDGVAHLRSGNVEGAELALELVRVVDHGGEVAEGDEEAVVEEAADEAGVAVAALLAVGEDVDAGADLSVDAEADGVVGGGLEVGLIQAALEAVVDGLEHPAGAGPAANAHDGEGRDGGRGLGVRQRFGHGDPDAGVLCAEGDGRLRGRRGAFGQRALADEEAALAAFSRPGDQLVAGQAAPGGQLDLDG